MKKTYFLIFALFLILAKETKAQNDASVEQSIYGLQIGFLGIWGIHEARLTNNIALRSEIGFDAAMFGSNKAYSGSNVGVVLYPSLTLEPRFYYNLKKRTQKGRSIANNNGNFIAFKINYRPNWFTLSNVESSNGVDNIAFIPKWAIKRTVLQHLTFEVGMGVGYRLYFYPDTTDAGIAYDLHLRIGYTF